MKENVEEMWSRERKRRSRRKEYESMRRRK
jgi:hypothetical protein